MWPFKSKQKHKFDTTKPLIGNTGAWRKDDAGGFFEIKITGFECVKCGKVLWLEKWQIKHLPKPMSYCNT